MLHSISEQPLRTNLRKIFREGYHYLTHDGKKFSLTLKDRAAVGWVGRLFNPHKLALRLSLLAIERARHAPAAHMADGYARYSPPPGGEALEAALKVADEKIAIFQRWRAGDRSGVAPADRAAYEAETFKTLHDPLKHAPHRYDEAAARALIRLFLQPELYLTAAEDRQHAQVLGGGEVELGLQEQPDQGSRGGLVVTVRRVLERIVQGLEGLGLIGRPVGRGDAGAVAGAPALEDGDLLVRHLQRRLQRLSAGRPMRPRPSRPCTIRSSTRLTVTTRPPREP